MRRILTMGSGVVALALAMIPFVWTSGAAASTSRSAQDGTFTLVALPRTGLLPVPGSSAKKVTKGDELILNDKLAAPTGEEGHLRAVGHDNGTCVVSHFNTKGIARGQCAVTIVLPEEGTIAIQGQVRFNNHGPAPSVLAVTGGTGVFTGVSGTVLVTHPAGRHFLLYTFNVG